MDKKESREVTQSGLLNLLNDHWSLVKTFTLILFVCLIFWLLLQAIREMPIYEVHLAKITTLTSAVLNVIGIEHELQRAFAVAHNDMIATDIVNIRLVIGEAFDGIFPMICFVAVVLVLGRRWALKTAYLMVGVFTLYVCNVFRATLQVALDQYFPLYFDAVNYFIAPVLLIFLPLLLLLYGWIVLSNRLGNS